MFARYSNDGEIQYEHSTTTVSEPVATVTSGPSGSVGP